MAWSHPSAQSIFASTMKGMAFHAGVDRRAHTTYIVQLHGVNDKEYVVLQKKPGEVQRTCRLRMLQVQGTHMAVGS